MPSIKIFCVLDDGRCAGLRSLRATLYVLKPDRQDSRTRETGSTGEALAEREPDITCGGTRHPP